MLGLLSSAEFIQFGFTNPHAILQSENVLGPTQTKPWPGEGEVRVKTSSDKGPIYIFMSKNMSCTIFCEMYMKFICTAVVDETEE